MGEGPILHMKTLGLRAENLASTDRFYACRTHRLISSVSAPRNQNCSDDTGPLTAVLLTGGPALRALAIAHGSSPAGQPLAPTCTWLLGWWGTRLPVAVLVGSQGRGRRLVRAQTVLEGCRGHGGGTPIGRGSAGPWRASATSERIRKRQRRVHHRPATIQRGCPAVPRRGCGKRG